MWPNQTKQNKIYAQENARLDQGVRTQWKSTDFAYVRHSIQTMVYTQQKQQNPQYSDYSDSENQGIKA